MRLVRRARGRRLMFLLMASLLPVGSHASEGGGHNLASGAPDWGDGYLPLPDTTAFAGYVLWLHATSVRDNAGNSAVPEFRGDLVAHAGRILHTWAPTWHGLQFTSGVVYVVDYAKIKTGPSRDEDADLDDVSIEPVYLHGAVGELHWMTGPAVYWGVGKYNPVDPANAAAHYGHYATYYWETGLTWQPTPRFEVSLDTTQARNSRNWRTQYRSGDLIDVDFGATGQPIAGLPLGIGWTGFWIKQVSDDRQGGVTVPNLRIDQFSTGPQFTWTFNPSLAMLIKYQHDLHSVNAAKGNRVWFEWTMPISLPGATRGARGGNGACCAPGPPMPVPPGP